MSLIFLAQGAMSRRQTDSGFGWPLLQERCDGMGGGRRHDSFRSSNKSTVSCRNCYGQLVKSGHITGERNFAEFYYRTDPGAWKDIYNDAVEDERWRLSDDPVPKSVIRTLRRIDVASLSDALKEMPIRARGGGDAVSERLKSVRKGIT